MCSLPLLLHRVKKNTIIFCLLVIEAKFYQTAGENPWLLRVKRCIFFPAARGGGFRPTASVAQVPSPQTRTFTTRLYETHWLYGKKKGRGKKYTHTRSETGDEKSQPRCPSSLAPRAEPRALTLRVPRPPGRVGFNSFSLR